MQLTHPSGTLGNRASRVTVAGVAAQGRPADFAGMNLADLTTGTSARVVSVDSTGGAELGRRLAELGFLPGERLRIVARGMLGKEPIAVRIGTGTFALRLFEAACIRVSPERAP
jgi:ferrous iron transport protein A